MAKSSEKVLSNPNVEIPTEAVGLSQRIEARLDMVLRELVEVRRENASLQDYVKRMVRRNRTIS